MDNSAFFIGMPKKILLREGDVIVEEFEFKAKEHFRRVKKRYNIAFSLRNVDMDLAYMIGFFVLEGLAFLKYGSGFMNTGRRFKRFVQEYGDLEDEFIKEGYLDHLWSLYRNCLVHEYGLPDLFHDNISDEDFGVIAIAELPPKISKKSELANMKYIKLRKMYKILWNCIDNLEREFSPTEKSVFIRKKKLTDPPTIEIEYRK
jgi:hypothetical protein